ncbi:winged helix-turn-helix domain-containing protein [Litorilituus sediminis]|uniref:Transcriptional regulator n=1 Tax=Litorilituus sediminis TaxID=718192 RepID=A0A4P6P0J5_9GAMM|nr:winged helix-turn-helix domain-containing protein [Litorilituus sediminis]QBG34626.1 transcriptional regulator [Litorilituus sediminis]
MIYCFNDFEFDSDSLTLTQNKQPITIRHNEAKILALLLSKKDEVLNKEAILDLVWQDKVVSEQAVFQNISHLRNLFGNAAIKTFPKRGYQWQLATTLAKPAIKQQAVAEQVIEHPLVETLPAQKTIRKQALLLCVCAIFLGLFIIFSFNNDEQPPESVNLGYIPIVNDNNIADFELVSNKQLNITPITSVTNKEFATSSELYYTNLREEYPLILTGQYRVFAKQHYLDFIVKGPYDDWQGQLSANSKTELASKLDKHLSQLFIYSLVNKPQSPAIKQATLSIAYQEAPNDLIILGALSNSYIDLGELEKTMVLANKLEQTAFQNNSPLQQGNALLLQSTVLTQKKLIELSSDKLTKAISVFESINDLHRQADAWNAQSWLDHQNKDYPKVKESLLSSAKLALKAQDIPRELHALTYLSIMAHKHKQETDKYLYLQQAENKMNAYQLPSYHFAKVPFHYAIFAQKKVAKEPHFKRVLEYSQLTPNHWVAQNSREQLMKFYLAENRLTDAAALLVGLDDNNTPNNYLKTLLAQANQQSSDFIHYAQQTFETAQLSGNKRISLNVALLMLTSQDKSINADFYAQYIDENANDFWRKSNKEQLMALNL